MSLQEKSETDGLSEDLIECKGEEAECPNRSKLTPCGRHITQIMADLEGWEDAQSHVHEKLIRVLLIVSIESGLLVMGGYGSISSIIVGT